MQESLQSARNIHNILIIVCTAVLIFSLSMSGQLNKYQLGLDELLSLEELFNDTETKLRKVPTSYDSLNLLYRNDLYTADSLLQTLKKSSISDIKDFLNSSENSVHGRVLDRRILSSFIIEHFRYYGLTNGQKPGQSLPLLSNVWDYVRYETIEDSKRRLKDEAIEFSKQPESDLDIAGLHVNGSNLYLIAPFIIISLLLYLLLLVNHVTSILDDETEKVLKPFPWVALFPNVTSQMVMVVTLLIFPSAGSLAIISRSPLSENESTFWMVAYIIICLLVSPQMMMKIIRIQDKVHYNGQFFATKNKASSEVVQPGKSEAEP